MRPSESTFILFVRSITLLAFLIAVPGIAVCWNHLPKDFWNQSDTRSEPQSFQQESDESMKPVTVFVPESNYPFLSESQPAVASTVVLPMVEAEGVPSIQQVSWEQPAHDFTSLVERLKVLGATYYKLQKWGNRGELFHFSCTVSPSEFYAYEKYFQAIGTDEIAVMQEVIADIEQWKTQK
jgi:hypothetical protein